MSLESKISYELNKHPGIKKGIKRLYQIGMYTISRKLKSDGNIVRISPNDGQEYFFGYYDKSPWDSSGRYVLCLRAKNTWEDVSPKETADIILVDTQKENSVKKIAETKAWNVQQGCMLQWLGPDFSSRILFNDYRDEHYVSVIKNMETGEERVIDAAVYTVSSDGKFALTLDFSRLYSLRPGYGYYNQPETTKGIELPDATAVWGVNLESGEINHILNYKNFASFEPRPEMLDPGSVHKVNHLMLSPNNKRFMVLYRWFVGARKYTRLITCNIDGTEMYVLSDDDMVSHCFWKDDENIIAFENKKETGSGYYLMKDKTQEYTHHWKHISYDGHPSYSPDGKYVVTDSYPNRKRVADIKLLKDTEECGSVICRVFAPFKYDNDTRCDLHPRWSRDGKKICFDSVFEGHRGLYSVDVSELISHNDVGEDCPLVSIIVPIYNVSSYLKRCVDSLLKQSYTNYEIILVNDGSTDNSLELCNELAKSSSKIVVVDKENGGLSSARNAGIDVMRGQYVMFIDGDDYIHEDMLSKMFYLIKKNEADIATCKLCKVFGDNCTIKSTDNRAHRINVWTGEEALSQMFYPGGIGWSACNKLYRAELFATERYVEGVYMEDMATTYKLYSNCNKVVETSEELYYYYIREDGITGTKSSKRGYDAIENIEKIIEFYKEKYPQLLDDAYAHYAKIAPNFLVTLNCDQQYTETQLKCIRAIKIYGNYALKAPFVKKVYKIIVAVFRVIVTIGGKHLVNSKLFHIFCKMIKKWIK